MDKQQLRVRLKKARERVLDRDNKNLIICKNAFEFVKKAAKLGDSIFIYQSFSSEACTKKIIEQLKADYKICVPRVDEDFFMEAVLYSGPNSLPPTTIPPKSTHSLVVENPKIAIVPLLGYNAKLHRIGYGKGCYDKYFSRAMDIIKVGLAFSCQKCDFEPNNLDVPLDFIITEEGLISL